MRVTEQQLYNMICESINNALMEADEEQQTQYPDVVGNFDEKGAKRFGRRISDKIRRVTTSKNPTTGKWVNGIVGGVTAGYIDKITDALGDAGLNFTGIDLNGAGVGITSIAIIGVIAYQMVKNWQSWNAFDKTEVPTDYTTAFKCSNIAAVQRETLLKNLVVAQENLCNATHAWNKVFPDNPKDWNTIKGSLQNVSNRYLGESTNRNINESQTSKIKSVGEFIQEFTKYKNSNQIEQLNKAYEEALNLCIKASTAVTEINQYLKLIEGQWGKNGLTFQNMVDGNKRNKLMTWVRSKLPNIFKSNEEANQKNREKSKASVVNYLNIRVVYVTQSYVVFRQEKTNHYLYLKINNAKGTYNIGDGYVLKYNQNVSLSKNVKTGAPLVISTPVGTKQTSGANYTNVNAYVLNPMVEWVNGQKTPITQDLKVVHDTPNTNMNNTNNSNNNGTNI